MIGALKNLAEIIPFLDVVDDETPLSGRQGGL